MALSSSKPLYITYSYKRAGMVTGRILLLGPGPLLSKHGNMLSFLLPLLFFCLLFQCLLWDFSSPHWPMHECCRLHFLLPCRRLQTANKEGRGWGGRKEGREGGKKREGEEEGELSDEMKCVNANCHHYPLNKWRRCCSRTGWKNWTVNKSIINLRNCLNMPPAVSFVNTVNTLECLNCI